MEKFEELAEQMKASIDKLITTDMPQEQIAQMSALKDQVDGLKESHHKTEEEALKTKEKYIELVKGYGTSKAPEEVGGGQPRSLEQIADAVIAQRAKS